ncbi:hypothetical protein [Elioraea rosea]|uniref:hypothetical protein n=1 Tax=Elioraea rosea TaxID=2492390 RepID=UPI001182CF14|nr:hypothetical protein [Elioraea rosea]
MIDWLLGRHTVEIVCDLDLEQTAESLHAYSIPVGIDIGPGDELVMHGAPAGVPFGERATMQVRATVRRAGWYDRAMVHLGAFFTLTELYNVGFEDIELPEVAA